MIGCFRTTPLVHPWLEGVDDTPCGYDRKVVDEKCVGCYRREQRKLPATSKFEVTPDLLRAQASWGLRSEAARASLRR